MPRTISPALPVIGAARQGCVRPARYDFLLGCSTMTLQVWVKLELLSCCETKLQHQYQNHDPNKKKNVVGLSYSRFAARLKIINSCNCKRHYVYLSRKTEAAALTRSHPEMVGDMSRVTYWPWTMTYLKFLLCISSQDQDLYAHPHTKN